MANNSNTYRKRRAKRPKRPSNSIIPKSLSILLTIVLLGLGAVYALGRHDESQTDNNSVNLGDKLLCVTLPENTSEIIKDYEGFTVSFNSDHHVPNYVAWELTGTEAQGKEPRNSKFRADEDVAGCPTIEDYRNSGFDRGHMAPAADMKWSKQAMLDSHYLTNMCPQDHSLNSGRWSTLEDKCRQWAIRDSALVIIAGPVLSDIITRTIGSSHISVPERFFKVILSPYSTPPRAIGFIMANAKISDGIESMAISVDQVEEITGYDFFAALPDEIEEQIESQANYRDWNRRKR